VGLTGRLNVQYYKIPAVLVSTVDLPAIDYRWRMYLVWLTLFWARLCRNRMRAVLQRLLCSTRRKTSYQ